MSADAVARPAGTADLVRRVARTAGGRTAFRSPDGSRTWAQVDAEVDATAPTAGTVGRPLPGVELRRPDDDGRGAEEGDRGTAGSRPVTQP